MQRTQQCVGAAQLASKCCSAPSADAVCACAVLGAIYGLQVRTTVSGGAHPAHLGCIPLFSGCMLVLEYFLALF